MLIPIKEISLGERVREDYGRDEWKDLVDSISTHGLIVPLLVSQSGSGPYTLVAGGRRYRAIVEIYGRGGSINGLPDGMVECAVRDLNDHTKLLLEGEENLRRKDFTPLEKAKFIRVFHDKMKSMSDGKWGPTETAAVLKLSQPLVNDYLRVEEAARSSEAVAKAVTLKGAVKRLRTEQIHKNRMAAAKLEAPDAHVRASAILSLGDARELISRLDSSSIDFVNFDPPWGDEASHKSATNHEAFDDSTEYSDALAHTLLPELFRVLKDNRYLCFWYRNWAYSETIVLLERYGFSVKWARTPCIWYKPDKNNDQNRYPEKKLNDAYETFFLATKGDPVFYTKYLQNVFPFDRVPRAELIHPTEKPLALCQALIQLCSVPGETVLDPTAGSSSFIASAIQNNRKAIGFELSETYYNRGITRLSEYLKTVKEIKSA